MLAALIGAALAALVFSSSALALDHVVLASHEVSLGKALKLPACRKGHKSSRSHPCHLGSRPVYGKGVPDAGWHFSLQLSAKDDGTWPLAVTLKRTTGAVVEQHTYSFTLSAGAVTVAPDLSSATVDTGGQLAQFGSIKLTLSHLGAPSSATPTPGCSGGNWQMRSGRLTGLVRFVADGSYFRTIVETSLPADLSGNTGSAPTCTTFVPPCGHNASLSASVGNNSGGGVGPVIYASTSSTTQGMGLLEFLSTKSRPATISHDLSEMGLPLSDFTEAADLSSASVMTTGSQRFTGSLSFTPSGPTTQGPYPACGAGATYSVRLGTTTGGIQAHFLAIPPPMPALGQSFLSKS